MELSKKTISEVIKFCNRDLVPDPEFDPSVEYHSDWFVNYFSFLNNPSVEQHLGDAFYQARFTYKLMNALRLPAAKQFGIVKFQIVQYASICEAVLDTAINQYFKETAEEAFSITEYVKYRNALSPDTKITHKNITLTLCQEKKKKGVLKRTRIDFKTTFAVEHGLITPSTKEAFDALYNLRNNVHILKAADSQYRPKIREAKDAFLLMQTFVSEVKTYYTEHPC